MFEFASVQPDGIWFFDGFSSKMIEFVPVEIDGILFLQQKN